MMAPEALYTSNLLLQQPEVQHGPVTIFALAIIAPPAETDISCVLQV